MATSTNPLDAQIGERVREHREALGMSIRELAERMTEAGKPMSAGRLWALEKGKHPWDTRGIYAAAVGLNISPELSGILALPEHVSGVSIAFARGGIAGAMEWLAKRIPPG